MPILYVNFMCTIISTLYDLKTGKIPNFITLPAIVLGLILNAYYSGLEGLKDSLLGMILGILLLLIPFVLHGLGAGDVKLLAAIGALNGSTFVFYTFLYSAMAGGLLALAIALFRGQIYTVMTNVWVSLQGITLGVQDVDRPLVVTSGLKFPYGVAFLIGTIVTYWLR